MCGMVSLWCVTFIARRTTINDARGTSRKSDLLPTTELFVLCEKNDRGTTLSVRHLPQFLNSFHVTIKKKKKKKLVFVTSRRIIVI